MAELRVERGWSQDAFAERLNVSVKYLQRLEKGRQNMTVDLIVGLAEHLDVEFESLMQPSRDDAPRRLPVEQRKVIRRS